MNSLSSLFLSLYDKISFFTREKNDKKLAFYDVSAIFIKKKVFLC